MATQLPQPWHTVVVLPKLETFLAIAHKFNPHNVNLPRGESREGELSPIETAFRSMLEQTSVRALEARLVPLELGFKPPLYIYLVTEHKGLPVTLGHGRAFWATKAQLLQDTCSDHGIARAVLALLGRI